MSLTPSTIHPGKRTVRRVKRVGRGNSSGRGTYSSRGLKGQRARSGGKRGLQLKGFKMRLQKVHKLRGFTSRRIKPVTITLAQLEKICNNGEKVTINFLRAKRLIGKTDILVKVVASGTLTKSVHLADCLASKSAIAVIEKAGGTLTF